MEEHHHRSAFVLLTITLILLAIYMRPNVQADAFSDCSSSDDSDSSAGCDCS